MALIKKIDKQRLRKAVTDIENNSVVELVVVTKEESANYAYIYIAAASLFAGFIHLLVVFLPFSFYDLEVFLYPFAAFILAFILIKKMPFITRKILGLKKLTRNVEILSRAIFQKVGVYNTFRRTGILIYCSILERQVVVIADRGVELALPQEILLDMKKQLQDIWKGPKPMNAFLNKIEEFKSILSSYLPSVPDDVNELPDEVEIDF